MVKNLFQALSCFPQVTISCIYDTPICMQMETSYTSHQVVPCEGVAKLVE